MISETVEVLIASYKESAAVHGDATLEGDYSAANTAYEHMVDCLKKLREIDPSGDVLSQLFNCNNESVRLWAATHSLFSHEMAAKRIIESISEGEGIISFSAAMVLDEWHAGRLKDPCYDDLEER